MAINLGIDDLTTLKFWKAILAEFFGMIFFLLIVTTVAVPWNLGVDVAAQNVEIGIGIGLAIATIAMMIGHVSGGHLNPAVSLGMIVGGRISVLQGLLYIPAQLVGGIVGSALTYACTPLAQRLQNNLGVTEPGAGVLTGQAFGLELLFTFVLVFFVFSITDPIKKVEAYGVCLGIGVCILVCHVCLIPYTGCGINPARSFGPAVVMGKFHADHWVYWIGPFVGAILAALIYTFVFAAEEEKRSEEAPESCAMDVEATQA